MTRTCRPQTPLSTLTDAIGKPLQEVLGQQQVCEQCQTTQLYWQLLQPVLRHIQAHKTP